jgi:hypothetical protein
MVERQRQRKTIIQITVDAQTITKPVVLCAAISGILSYYHSLYCNQNWRPFEANIKKAIQKEAGTYAQLWEGLGDYITRTMLLGGPHKKYRNVCTELTSMKATT